MKKIWFDEAWEDYDYWQSQDKKMFFQLASLCCQVQICRL